MQRTAKLDSQLAEAQAALEAARAAAEADAAAATERFQAQCAEIRDAATAAGREASEWASTPWHRCCSLGDY